MPSPADRLPGPARGVAPWAVAVVAATLLLGGCSGRGDLVGPRPPVGEGAGPAGVAAGGGMAGRAEPATFRASDVLRAWDEARSRAFAEGDVAALRAMYVEGSAAGTSDARLLRAYVRRGLRVDGMRMQLLAVQVLREERRLLRVRVTDRLVGAVAVRDGARTPLPQDRASTRFVELRRSREGQWRVATVRESARRQAVR